MNDVSKEEANLIVNRHNVYRQAIIDGTVRGQPRGINVKFMVKFFSGVSCINHRLDLF